jgi:beta-lactamase class C
MNTRTLLLITQTCLILQSASLYAATPGQQSAEQQLADQFDAYFRKQVMLEDLTGAAFAMATPDGIVRIGTVGHTDTSRSKSIDQNTAFRIASVSKTFAAGLAGLLVNEGQFGWEDPVIDYVPDFRINGDAGKVRIQHVLGQSTGLIPHAYDNLIEDGLPLEKIEDQYKKLSYICQPGKCYSYQNSVFSLIQPVIEKTTAKSYAVLLEERIFHPLDMKSASVGYEPFINNPNHAKPHVKSRGKWKTVKVKRNYYRVAPAAGINASVLDMGKWLTAQMGGNPAVIDPDLIAVLTETRVKTIRAKRRRYWRDILSDAHYGLGWRIYQIGGHEIAYHSGWVSGFRADIAWSGDHNIGIAVLMNVESNSISELTTTFWQMAFDHFKTAARPEERKLLTAATAFTPLIRTPAPPVRHQPSR